MFAQFQHVTKAAQHLGISQPALSRAIAALEADIDARVD
jgi:DNA-binding transcriptional LysR family regulator